ncbi:retrovirus-related pol polyprotein from transposon TNT 1-94, partial [Tanacetum coccineum]
MGTINIGLWYPKGFGFELTALLDADHAGCLDTRKSTSGGIQFLGDLTSKLDVKETKQHALQYLQQRQSTWRYLQVFVIKTEYQLADMFTKALPEDRFKYLVKRIGMRCLTPADLEVVRLGINPMIQPEPEDLPKDNLKLEIAVLRVILFSIHNDEWKSFQCHHQTALRSNGAFKIMQKYEHVGQRTMTVARARETVGSQVVQQNGIQCFNCKGYGHYAKECRKPKRVKDYAYHKEKMMMCKQAEQGVPLQAEQADWLKDTNEEIDEQELEAHYSY